MTSLGVLADHRIIPVIVIDDVGAAVDVAEALIRGGIHFAEVTLRTDAAVPAIRAMAALPGFTVGAGTVITPAQLDSVTDAGASFIVSPGLDDELIDTARTRGLGVLPGVATGTEIMRAARHQLHAVKFFPADQLGGLSTIRALSGPFPQIGFIPSGGVSSHNAAEYLADPAVPAVSGSWMATRGMIADRNFHAIEQATTASLAALADA
ncbi:bifunctional 4-hydroxy-2-oxoglutarate aldolase/2-dehydro-3-deoxy-phosphogluconate aldolase [Microbacteriaceae bacterium 4G12]